jgi:uncharacterized CHY-type Zn-finger protein
MKHLKLYEDEWSWTPEPIKLIKSKIDPTQSIILKDCKYTNTYIEETLIKHRYAVPDSYEKYHGNKITCPLCKKEKIIIEHSQKLKCPLCNLQITNFGNALHCKIDKEDLELYNNLNKYNI